MAEMTISQALRRIKKLKGQLAENLIRSQAGVSYRVGAPPAFAFTASVQKADAIRQELVQLESRLAVTNATARIDFHGDCPTIAFAIRQLQELKSQIAWYRALPVRAHEETSEETWDYDEGGKHVRTQVPWKCDLPEEKRATVVDDLQDQFDRLNDAVERANHATVLMA